jgi:hypothetical protein
MYGERIPAKEVFDILDDYDMPELKSKIRAKKSEPKEDMSMDEKLYGNQDKLDVDNDGEIDASDLSALRKGDHNEEEGDCMECGDGYMEEGNTCEECGKEICECGGGMYESSIKLNESELISLIAKIVNESFPGAEKYNTVHKDSGKENSDALSDVEQKIKNFLSFDDNDNPEFPNQIGGEVKARRADEDEADEVALNRGGGLEDLAYDIEPSEEAKERHKKALTGHTTMGNSQDAANVIPSKLGEKMIKKVKRKKEAIEAAPMYGKDPQPSTIVKESKLVSEEILRMKQMASYNKKTQ